MGAHVVSGEATAIVVRTGEETELGQISERLQYRPPETDFERGIRYFGHLLLEVTLLLVLAIFAINVYYQRPIFDSFLFALALAVGLTPQLLPAIITINLASGARDMARENVIVKQPSSIENFGSMDVFCADKTGTLTEGTIQIHSAIDIDGNQSERVFLHAYLNSSYESGFENPIDEAIARNRVVPLVGGSDAHFPFETGRAYTRVDTDELTPTAIVDAIRDGRVEPIIHETPSIRFIRWLYAQVHHFRGHIDRSAISK